MTHHGHRPVQAPVLGQVQPQTLGMAPGTALQPGDVDRIIGVAEAIDIVGSDAQINRERCCQIPTHARSRSVMNGQSVTDAQADCRAGARRRVSSARTPSINFGSDSTR
ncbi:hypothetical protein D3C76_1153420 [compost metagenome]